MAAVSDLVFVFRRMRVGYAFVTVSPGLSAGFGADLRIHLSKIPMIRDALESAWVRSLLKIRLIPQLGVDFGGKPQKRRWSLARLLHGDVKGCAGIRRSVYANIMPEHAFSWSEPGSREPQSIDPDVEQALA